MSVTWPLVHTELRPGDQWRSIESAPKDESLFLAYAARTRTMDVCRMENISSKQPFYVLRATNWNWEHHDFPEEDFTHWMPLPEPPTVSEE